MQYPTFEASYKVITDKRLVIEVFNGAMFLSAYKEYKLKQAVDPAFSPTYDLIADVQDVVIDGTINEVKEYAEFVVSHGNIVGLRKNATIVNTLNQKIYSNIFHNLHTELLLPQDFQLFTDLKSALNWINKDISCEEIKLIIQQLKSNPTNRYSSNKDY